MTRLYAYAGAALGLLLLGFLGGWKVQGWRYEASLAEAVQTAHRAEKQAQLRVINSLKTDIKAGQESSNAYQNELARLRANPPVIRVRERARCPAADLPRESTTPSGSDAAAEAGGVVPGEGENNHRLITEMVDAGDQCSAQLRALIDWVNKTR